MLIESIMVDVSTVTAIFKKRLYRLFVIHELRLIITASIPEFYKWYSSETGSVLLKTNRLGVIRQSSLVLLADNEVLYYDICQL